MADKKAQFKRIIAARIARGEHYMTEEKFKAQMDFYKNANSCGKIESDKVSSTDDRIKT